MTRARIIHRNHRPARTGTAVLDPNLFHPLPTGPLTPADHERLAAMIKHLETWIDDNGSAIKSDPDLKQAVDRFSAQVGIVDLLIQRNRLVDGLAGDLPALEQHLGRPRPTGSYQPTGGTLVYIAFNQDDKPLYVGVTDDLFGRMASHRRGAPWWDQMVKLTWEEWHDRDLALGKELKLIRRYRPPFNKVGNPDAKENR